MEIYLIYHLVITVSLKEDLRNWHQLKEFYKYSF
jgi:hypothetical protein